MTTTAAEPEFEQLWLPNFAWATDNHALGMYRMPRPDALQRRFVQANPDAIANLFVVDVDHADAALRAVSSVGSHPMPNVIVENPRNGHAHVVWALTEPFTRTEYARRGVLAYAAAVSEGLRRAVDGDKSYGGLMTKNPTHPSWRTEWITTEPRTLDELAAGLGTNMPPKTWRRPKGRRPDVVGLGRNCALFETARHWAYAEVRNHWGDPAGLGRAIAAKAALLNAEFAEPLPPSEVRAIAASITRWITTQSRMWADGPVVYEATLSTMQAARGRKSGRARQSAVRAALVEAVARG